MKVYRAGIQPYYADILKKAKVKEPCLVNYEWVVTNFQ